jgi:hypothetical protein
MKKNWNTPVKIKNKDIGMAKYLKLNSIRRS